MNSEETSVSLMAAANLSLNGVGLFFTRLEPVLHGVITVAQILVALVTVIYIVKKIAQVRKPAAPKKRKK